MDHFTRESRHTRDVINLPQTFARVDKTGNLYRFCCKTVELLVNQLFATCNNLIFYKTGLTHFAAIRECLCKSGPVDLAWFTDLAHSLRVVRHCLKQNRPDRSYKDTLLMLQIKLHLFLSPFYRIITHMIGVNQMKITRYTSRLWNFTVCSELSKFIRLKIVLTFFS